MVDKNKLFWIAEDENAEEVEFAKEMKENGDMWKVSMRIALLIKRAMCILKITPTEMAEKMNISKDVLKEHLSGKFNFDLKTIVNYEKTLGIKLINTVFPKGRDLV